MAEPASSFFDSVQVIQVTIPVRDVPVDPRGMVRAQAALDRLSAREREILPLLAARWTDREIGEILSISHRTVTTHVSHIFTKLDINSRREVVPYVLVAGEAIA
jgi:DNA-binding CsgD family transcriptional regulator